MKKSVVKALAALLALVLVISSTPVAVLASESVHTHNLFETDTFYSYAPYDNSKHIRILNQNYACACGYETYAAKESGKQAHDAMPDSGLYLGSYARDDGRTVSSYQFTCKLCSDTYTREVVE